MTAPHKYRVFARDLGTFTCTAPDRRTAVVTIALRLASLGLMTEKDADRVRRWAVSDKVSTSNPINNTTGVNP